MSSHSEPSLFRIPVPVTALAFTGERFTSAVEGEIRHEHFHRYFFALQFCENKDVLDVASGEGYGAALIAMVARNVVGVDNSHDAVKHATANYANRNLSFRVGAAESLPLADQSQDVVLSFETLEHIEKQDIFLSEVRRVLRPGGLLVISTPDHVVYERNNQETNPFHTAELTKQEFESFIGKSFPCCAFLSQNAMTGSVITDNGIEHRVETESFRRVRDNLFEVGGGIPSATYQIAVASDSPLPALRISFFDDRPFQLQLYEELQSRHITILHREQEVARVHGELSAMELRARELDAQIAANTTTHQSVKAKHEDEAARLQHEISDRDRQIVELHSHEDSLRAELDNFQSNWLALEADRNRLQLECASLAGEVVNRRAENETFREESLAKDIKLETVKTQLGDALHRVDELSSENIALTEELTRARSESERQINLNAALNSSYASQAAAFTSKVSALQAEIETLRTELLNDARRRALLKSLANEEANWIQKVESKERQEAQLISNLENAQRELEAADGRFRQLQQVNSNLGRVIAAMTAESHAFRQSASWRVTSPLRSAAKRIRVKTGANGSNSVVGIRDIANRIQRSGLFLESYYRSQVKFSRRTSAVMHYIKEGAKADINPHPLFDSKWYLQRNSDVASTGVNPLFHYLEHGGKEGRSPHLLFDASFYATQVPGLLSLPVTPLEHFLQSVPDSLAHPHALFDSNFYLSTNKDVAEAQVNPLVHYVLSGFLESRNPHRLFDGDLYKNQLPDTDWRTVNPLVHYLESQNNHKPHHLFDPQFYLTNNPDIAAAGLNPLLHYVQYGGREGRSPHPIFDGQMYVDLTPELRVSRITPLEHFLIYQAHDPHPLFSGRHYLAKHLDIAEARINPLVHYVSLGFAESRSPHPLFDTDLYRSQFPNEDWTVTNPLAHYTQSRTGANPHLFFDTSYYLTGNPDIRDLGVSPLQHYLAEGANQGSNPHPFFNSQYYLHSNPDVSAAGFNPLLHYVEYGAEEHRNFHLLFDTAYYLWRNQVQTSDALRHYLTNGREFLDSPHPLFDPEFYLATNQDVQQSGIAPFLHYVVHGCREGRDPHALFEFTWYSRQEPSAWRAPFGALGHYLEQGALTHDPHPLFDTDYYLRTNPDVRLSGIAPLAHYVQWGSREGRDPHPLFQTNRVCAAPNRQQDQLTCLERYLREPPLWNESPHPLFDGAFYLTSNPGVKAEHIAPLYHYLSTGSWEGRWPHALFDPAYYRRQDPGIEAAGLEALTHFVLTGAAERRNPHPLFDLEYYTERNPETSPMNPLEHFWLHGAWEGRDPHPLFETHWYLKRNPDVARAKTNPLAHFIWSGAADRRNPHPLFNTAFYLEQKPELLISGMSPLVHYLLWGAYEGLDPDPRFDSSFYLESYPGVAALHLNPLVHYVLAGRSQGLLPHPGFLTALDPQEVDLVPPDPTEAVRLKTLERNLHHLAYRPLISVLVPVYNTPPKYLRLAIESVRSQMYANWDLYLVDDGSTSMQTHDLLTSYENLDPRIHIQRNATNGGISSATNSALASAKGEFVAMLDHDDVILPDALAEVAVALNQDRSIDVLYTDQEYINEDGSLHDKFYKPDWSLELFRGVMYVGHLLTVRRELALEIGGFDSRYDFCQDFEFMLRLAEKTDRIHHIKRVLYQWRRIPGSVALHGDEKAGIEPRQEAAVNAHFARMGVTAVARSNPSLAHRLLIYSIPKKSWPRVSVLVRTAGDPNDAKHAALSILDRTVGPEVNLFVEGKAEPTASILKQLDWPIRFVRSRSEFRAVVDTEYLVEIDANLEVETAGWLKELLLYAERDDVAFVSPLLLRRDGTVLNAGLITGPGAQLWPAMQGFPSSSDGYAGSLACAREVSAIAGNCFLIGTQKLRLLGESEPFRDAFYDLADLSLRARKLGMRNIHNPRVVVREIKPIPLPAEDSLDKRMFEDEWAETLRDVDPFYNPNFIGPGFQVPR